MNSPREWFSACDFTRTQLVAGFFVVLLVATPLAMAASGLFTSGSTFKTDSGLSVQVQQDQSLSGNPFADSQTFDGDGGTVSATSTGEGFLAVQNWGASGDTVISDVNVTGTTAVVNPDLSDKLGVSGSADSVSWDSYAADDGTADFSATVPVGSTASITLYGLSPSTQYRIVDAGGNVVDRTKSTSNGDATFEVSEGSYTLSVEEYDDPIPTVKNLQPDGGVVTAPIELRADVDDNSLPGSNVNVTFRLNGDIVHETTVTSAGQVNYTLTSAEMPAAGEHDWSVTAEDELGGQQTASASFGVAGNMTVRNVSNPSETIPNATATVYTDETTITIDADSNGNISLEALDARGPYVVVIEAPDYHERTTVIDNVATVGDAFLIPNSTATVLNRFTIEDPSGVFGSNTRIYLERPLTVNGTTSYHVVAADEAGVEGFSATLEEGERYRIRIVSGDGDVAQMGSYVADVSESVPLRPDTPAVTIDEGDTLAYSANVTDDGQLKIQYHDPENETEVLTIYAVNRFNESDYLYKPQTFYDTNSLSLSEPVGELSDSYIVIIEGQRDGESFTIRQPIGPDQITVLPPEFSLVWAQGIGGLLILLVGGVFSRENLGAGVVVTSLFGGVLWYIGFMSGLATWASVTVAITFSVLYAMVSQ